MIPAVNGTADATPAPVTETPAPAQPAAPAPAQPANANPAPQETPKPVKLVLVASKLSFETVCNLDPSEQDSLARDFVKKGSKVKDARTDYKAAAKATAKVLEAL